MTGDPTDGVRGAAGTGAEPSEEELRASYEAELGRITSTDMIVQAVVSLLNIAAHRLGPQTPDGGDGAAAPQQRDMEQVRDAIDAVRALLEILERRIPAEVRPLRDGLSRLQMAYASEVRAEAPGATDAPAAAPAGAAGAAPAPAGTDGNKNPKNEPGPAESSGRLWVPGR
jgi:hypothetical protein